MAKATGSPTRAANNQREQRAALRPLLACAGDDDATARLAEQGGRAYVSAALRPFLIAALAESGAGLGSEAASGARVNTPMLVVVGDDRAARDLAGDLRAWLRPREVRYYPSRGVTYESHLRPPPHLVGLRMAALDALLDTRAASAPEPPVVVVSVVALTEKVPEPDLRPKGFRLRTGD
jgi:transcription-repair coupling factor (superfamily II helicase)